MDWHPAIELNHTALKRILAMLLVMAGLDAADFGSGREKSAKEEDAGRATMQGKTLSRHLYRAVLALLRPAEAATRRLIIALARNLAVSAVVRRATAIGEASPEADEAQVVEKPRPPPVYVHAYIGMHCGVKSRFLWKAGMTFPTIVPFEPRAATASFSLQDRHGRFAAGGKLAIKTGPRDAQVDAARLCLRLKALARALENMPRYALRFARWQARTAARGLYVVRDAKGRRRVKGGGWPLRTGKPPGCRLKTYNPDTPEHHRAREIDRVAIHCHALAEYALSRPPDTS